VRTTYDPGVSSKTVPTKVSGSIHLKAVRLTAPVTCATEPPKCAMMMEKNQTRKVIRSVVYSCDALLFPSQV
jgi:hypothetical protein